MCIFYCREIQYVFILQGRKHFSVRDRLLIDCLYFLCVILYFKVWNYSNNGIIVAVVVAVDYSSWY